MLSLEAMRLLSAAALGFLVGGFALLARRRRMTPRRAVGRAAVGRFGRALWEGLVAAPLLFLALAAALPALAFVPGWTVPFPGDTAVQLFGLGLWAAGALLGLAAVRALGPFMAVDIAVWEDHELVTRGPYARIRHPAYTGAMLMAAGAALFLLHVLLFAVAFLTVALAVRRARLEESLLASTPPVAKAYRAYMARTGRFLPRRRTSRARFF